MKQINQTPLHMTTLITKVKSNCSWKYLTNFCKPNLYVSVTNKDHVSKAG